MAWIPLEPKRLPEVMQRLKAMRVFGRSSIRERYVGSNGMDAVEEVKSRLSIEDVIGEYVQLKRSGRNWKGLSPFSNERTPSFMVSPEKQIWHDFSSGKGGNMFSFVMEMEGLDFKAALELLARKAGIDIEQYRHSAQGSSSSKNKERVYEALELAAKFYQAHLKQNKAALEYVLKTRGFSKETALEWQLGYSPSSGTALIDFLRGKKFTDDEIKRAGLSTQRYRGAGDMFRGRLMIPLCDQFGKVVGFTARLLADEPDLPTGQAGAPKYINTPQTILYDKSRHVYGLHLAKEAIRKCKYVVLVEGNLDVIASHQAGVRQTVATAGTAMTEQHLKALSRFTGDIRLSFDADKAGLAATERAIPIASRVGVSLSIITIPSGKDPDELIRSGGVVTWQNVIEQPQYALDWLIERYQKLLDLTTAQGKKEFSDVILQVVRGLADQVEQEHYIEKVAGIIDVSREALLSKLKAPNAPVRLKHATKSQPELTDKTLAELTKAQDHLMALTLMQPNLRDFLAPLTADMLVSESARKLLDLLRQQPGFMPSVLLASQEEVATALPLLADYGKILALQYEELYRDLELLELRYEAARLQVRVIENYVRTQKQALAHQLAEADDRTTRGLLERAKELDQLLKVYKGQASSAASGSRQ